MNSEPLARQVIAKLKRRIDKHGWKMARYIVGVTADPVGRKYTYLKGTKGEPFTQFEVLVEGMTREIALAVEERVFTMIQQSDQRCRLWKLANTKIQRGRYHRNLGRAMHDSHVLYVAY